MTLLNDRPAVSGPDPDGMTVADPSRRKFGRTLVKWITSTDHKVIGIQYFFGVGAFFRGFNFSTPYRVVTNDARGGPCVDQRRKK